jgi:hypothetical protein
MVEGIVNGDLLKVIGKTVYRGYVLTQQMKKTNEIFDTVIGVETLPYVRRAAIEFLAIRNSRGVENLSADIRPNRSGNYHHVELIFNRRLIITFNHLGSINGKRQSLPRPALFRDMLLVNNPDQMQLFPGFPEKYFGPEQIFAMVLHEGRDFPTAVNLAILNSKGTAFVERLPISLTGYANDTDVIKVEPLTPEFIEFVKQASGE